MDLKAFFWKCAGVDPAEVQHWKRHLQRKYLLFGWFVTMSGLVAGISGFLAFLTVFQSAIGAFIFATFFGLVVFNLYRFVVVNIGYRLGMGKSKRERFLSALPRVFMAFILGFVISKPIELLIFSPLIQEQATVYQEELYQKQVALIELKYQEIEQYQAEIDQLQSELQQKKEKLQEVQEVLTNHRPDAKDPLLKVFTEKEKLLSRELEDLKSQYQPQIASLKEQIAAKEVKKTMELARSRSKVKSSFSLLNQLTVLHTYVPKTWLLTTVMVLFYILPILGKIKFSKDDQALVYHLNEKGEWIGNRLKMSMGKGGNTATTDSIAMAEEALLTLEDKKKQTQMGWVQATVLVIGLIILVGELNHRNIFTDMLSVMLLLTAALTWLNIIEREIAAIALVFFTILGSFSIFLMQSSHPMLGVLLGVVVLFTFGILLIGSILPIMRMLYTTGIFLFLLIAMTFTVHSMFRNEGMMVEEDLPKEEQSDTLRVQNGADSTDYQLLISHLRIWNDYHQHKFSERLELWQKDYEESKLHHRHYSYPNYKTSEEFWGNVYHDFSVYDRDKVGRVVAVFDSLRKSRHLNPSQLAETVVTCVQNIPYTFVAEDCEDIKNNPKYKGLYEKHGCMDSVLHSVQTPTEFLYNLKGDCDTRTLLLYTLFSELGYKVAILNSEVYAHSILGLQLAGSGKFKVIEGRKYYLWETTARGWQLGMVSPEMASLDKWMPVLWN